MAQAITKMTAMRYKRFPIKNNYWLNKNKIDTRKPGCGRIHRGLNRDQGRKREAPGNIALLFQ
jgi:hypothetical protein